MDEFLSKYQCGFWKGFSVARCLLVMGEKWKQAVDNGQVFGTLSTDLSKAFDCLPLELLTLKVNSYLGSLKDRLYGRKKGPRSRNFPCIT